MHCAENLKKMILVFFGSLFLQIFCWAMYSVLEMRVWMCGLSAVIAAGFYHFLQIEQETGLSRRNVFFAAILAPFAVCVIIMILQFVKYPNLNLLSASLDGVSPMTELISLYSTRVALNGVVLMLFAPIDRAFRKENETNEKSS